MSMQYTGECAVQRGMFITPGDIMSTVGDIMSTLGGYHEYTGADLPQVPLLESQ